MKLTTLYLAASTALATAMGAQAAPAPIAGDPVKTDNNLNDFIHGAVDRITCSSNGETVQIVPLKNSAGNSFIAIEAGKATPLQNRQAAFNTCLEIGLK